MMSSLAKYADTLLLTGVPGIGKTTLVKKVARALSELRIQGFFTEEIRSQGRRQGFHLETFDRQRIILAHTDIQSSYRVGRYGVDVVALDSIVSGVLCPDGDVDLYLIDEIGKMECFSRKFQIAIRQLLDSGKPIIATIALKGGGFIQQVKERPNVALLMLTCDNREDMLDPVLGWVAGKFNRLLRSDGVPT